MISNENIQVLQLKNEANELFSKKEYSKAIQVYGEAIKVMSTSVLYSNRALCFINLAQYKDGLDDCLKAIGMDDNFKAYYRASVCYLHLGNIPSAIQMLNAGKAIKPSEIFDTQLELLLSISKKLELLETVIKSLQFQRALVILEELCCVLDSSLIGTGLPNCKF
jgi:tetratricopeptide (TPR) repeat protein